MKSALKRSPVQSAQFSHKLWILLWKYPQNADQIFAPPELMGSFLVPGPLIFTSDNFRMHSLWGNYANSRRKNRAALQSSRGRTASTVGPRVVATVPARSWHFLFYWISIENRYLRERISSGKVSRLQTRILVRTFPGYIYETTSKPPFKF